MSKKDYVDQFSDEWIALFENEVSGANYCGDVPSGIANDVYDILNELKRLRSRIAELESAQRWTKYVEGDESTYPKEDGALYEIIFTNEPGWSYGHEFYFFNDSWATDKEITYYRPIPPAPKEGEG